MRPRPRYGVVGCIRCRRNVTRARLAKHQDLAECKSWVIHNAYVARGWSRCRSATHGRILEELDVPVEWANGSYVVEPDKSQSFFEVSYAPDNAVRAQRHLIKAGMDKERNRQAMRLMLDEPDILAQLDTVKSLKGAAAAKATLRAILTDRRREARNSTREAQGIKHER